MPTGPAPTIFEAIVRKHCVAAVYNRVQVVLAPHVIFMRHDQFHVGAMTITRDGNPPREAKIGVFKLDGLGELRITERPFIASPLFDPADPRFADNTLMIVDRV